MGDDRQHYAALLRSNLSRAKRLRCASSINREDQADRYRLREWQSLRLARTHRDLLDSPRYGPAARFFLDDLYGPKDFSRRDEEVERIVPLMTRLLPPPALRTIAMAIGLDALSEELDCAVITALRASAGVLRIDDATYASAYRACDNRGRREEQIFLISEIGRALDGLTHMPMLSALLRAMRGPAHVAGLAELHEFLARGYAAFKHMGNAEVFLRTVCDRETALMNHWFVADAAG